MKVATCNSKGASIIGLCAGESIDFQNIQRSIVAGCALVKVKTFNSYGAVLTGSCAGESDDFQQLRGVFHGIVCW